MSTADANFNELFKEGTSCVRVFWAFHRKNLEEGMTLDGNRLKSLKKQKNRKAKWQKLVKINSK